LRSCCKENAPDRGKRITRSGASRGALWTKGRRGPARHPGRFIANTTACNAMYYIAIQLVPRGWLRAAASIGLFCQSANYYTDTHSPIYFPCNGKHMSLVSHCAPGGRLSSSLALPAIPNTMQSTPYTRLLFCLGIFPRRFGSL
jgi:hypothetical protein